MQSFVFVFINRHFTVVYVAFFPVHVVYTVYLVLNKTVSAVSCYLVLIKLFLASLLHSFSTESLHWIVVNDSSQRAHGAKITSLWRQNDVATSFWRHNDVIIASHVRCESWHVNFLINGFPALGCRCPVHIRRQTTHKPPDIMIRYQHVIRGITVKLKYFIQL